VSQAGTKPDVTSDWSLLERVEQKDEEAFSALYDRYSGLVFSEAKRILHGTGPAEEVLQDLFYHLWETADRFDLERGSLAGWLLVGARNRAVLKLRGKKQTAELDENGVALAADVKSQAAQSHLAEKVRGVLKSLADGQRQAVEYAYLEGMPLGEIAEKTGQPVETVKMRMRQAMEELTKVLR
jgi:RNA polymerase sigma-70 factor (ECF subfamily)